MMTPQQFGSLVGDQMGKDAGAVAPKSLPVEALKMVGKAVYHTPRSLKTLAAGGAGGYALGHNAGEASGMEQGKAEAAKNLAERLLGTPAAGVKTAGPISETLGFSSPANILGGAAALMTPTRSLEQQAKFDATDNAGRAIANAVVPGYGAYNMYKRMGSSIRSPEMKAMQAKAMQPQQAPVAAPAPAPTPAPASPLPAGTGQGGIMGGGGPYSMSLAGKQAGAINELLSEFGGRAAQGLKSQGAALAGKVGPALEQVKNVASDLSAKARSGLQTYGKRLTGDSTLKPLYQRADLMSDMGDDLLHNIPNPNNVAVNSMRYNPNPVGNPTQAVMDARRMRNTGNAAHTQMLRHQNDAQKAIARERDAIDLTRNLTTGGAAAGTIGAVGMAARNNNKQASLTEGLIAGVPMGLAGAGAGLGAGGLYGLLSGAYEAKKGKKLKGALGGLLRGAGGGALVGGGIGAGAGFGGGLMMPNVLTSNPIMQAVHATNLAVNPIGHAAKMTAGGIAGGVIGGNLANSQRKKMQDSKPTNNKKDDADEGEDNDDVEQIKSKAASEKEAARGDMVNKLMSYLKNRTLLQAEVVKPAGKAITGGWQTTSGVLGAPGGIHHHFSPSTVREVTTPPVLVRDLMQKAKDLMPASGGMPERGGGYFDNNQKDLAGVVKQLYQAKKTGVR